MVPVVDLTRIVEWVKNAAVDIIKWAALRALLIGLVGTLVPLAIYHGWGLIHEQIMTFVMDQVDGDFWTGSTVELNGIAAWIGTRLKLMESFQVLSTGLMYKFIFGFIKK